ncbi:MAG: GDSL-type esterase/lipase family protein [Clostridiales bacterium]|nr:GDSL-type esterase/lipase family protein [Clostridiales bacterium]
MNISKKCVCLFMAGALSLSLCACDLVGEESKPGATPPPQSDKEDSNNKNTASPDNTESVPPESPADTADQSSAYPEDGNTAQETASTEPSIEPSSEPTPETAPPAATDEPAAVTPPPSAESSAFQLSGDAILGETADMGMEYIDKMVFLGDSTTYGMKYYAVLTGGKNTKQVWTPSNGTLTLSYQGFASIVYPEDGSEIPIRDAVSQSLPEYLVITLGVNGVSFMDEDYFKSEYTDLVTDIQSLSPNTKIILQSIFPVASNYEYLSSINNEKIAKANGWVLEVAENTGVKFLNTASALVGADGWLPQKYQNGDGLHLNETGFSVVLSYIRTHGYQ